MTESPAEIADEIILRQGRRHDLEALIALENDFFGADHRISRPSFRRFISSPKSSLIVAEVGGKVAGCALVNYRKGSTRARLYTIAVGRGFQRRGIARRLLAEAEKAARGRGSSVIRLEVREDDPGAIALYESSGFTRFAKRSRYYEGTVDALLFEKPLRHSPEHP